MKTTTAYKIMNTNTGLFSTGGTRPSWNKNGKTWSSKATLRSHLTLWEYYNRGQEVPENWVVIELIVSTEEGNSVLARDFR